MMRRGLTMLEIVHATAILALIAATCIPLIQQATRALSESPPERTRVSELALEANDLAQRVQDAMSSPRPDSGNFYSRGIG